MTEKEYRNKLKQLKDEYEKNENKIKRDFAFANNLYKIGDTITDHISSIRITQIKWEDGIFGRLPECVYIGDNLTLKGTINKKDPVRKVYQMNIKKDKTK